MKRILWIYASFVKRKWLCYASDPTGKPHVGYRCAARAPEFFGPELEFWPIVNGHSGALMAIPNSPKQRPLIMNRQLG
jgi:hypothetical protein